MADNTVIAATVKVDTSLAAKQMSDLNKIIAEQKKIWKDAEIGSKEYEEAQKKLGEAQSQYNKIAEENGAGAAKQGEAFSILKGKVGGLVPGFKSAESGVQSFGAQLKVLMANPIVLMLTGIVVVLSLIYEAFTSTVEGGKKMKQIFAEIEAAGTILKDAVFALYRGLADLYIAAFKFITLDFKGAAASFKDATNEASGAMKELGKLTDGTLQKFGQLEKAQQENDLARKKSAVATSETNKLLVKSREILTDENATIDQKKKALEEVTAAETKSSAERVRIAAEDLSIIQAKQKLYGVETENGKKLKDQIRELTIAKNEAEQENAQTEFKLNKQKKQLEKQEKSEAAAADKEAKDKEKERITNLREFTLKDLKLKQELGLAAITDAKLKEEKIIDNAYQDELRANKLSVEEKKLTQQQADILNLDALNIANEKKKEIEAKFNAEKEKKDKEAQQKEIDTNRKFEAELNKIKLEIELSGITDVREKERKQLEISFAERFKQAEELYKDDIDKLGQIRTQLFIQQEAAQKALEKKFEDEDLKAKNDFKFKEIAFEIASNASDLKRQKDLLSSKKVLIDQQYAYELKAAKGNAIKISEIELKHKEDLKANADAVKAIDDKQVENKIAMANAIGGALNALSELVGKNTAVGKGLAIAAASIDTFTATQSAFLQATKNPITIANPAYPYLVAAPALASGIARVAAIASVNVPGGGASTGAVPSASAPIAPTQTSTALNAKSIQGVGNAAAQGVGRTFVLDSDIKDNASRQARLTRAARLA
jgi:hypothetical protein